MKRISVYILFLSLAIFYGCEQNQREVTIERNYSVEDVTGKISDPEVVAADPVSHSQPTEEIIAEAKIEAVTESIRPDMAIKAFFPVVEKIAGYESVTDAEYFVGQNLYEYINGGAELYHARGFRQVVTREYGNDDPDASVIVDIYDMGKSENAISIFDNQTEGAGTPSAEIGLKSAIGGGELVFCEDRYFIRLTTFTDTEESSKILKELAAAIDSLIKGNTNAG